MAQVVESEVGLDRGLAHLGVPQAQHIRMDGVEGVTHTGEQQCPRFRCESGFPVVATAVSGVHGRRLPHLLPLQLCHDSACNGVLCVLRFPCFCRYEVLESLAFQRKRPVIADRPCVWWWS